MSQFHFLYPIWLVALLPLALLLWLSFKSHAKGNAWKKVIDPDLLAVLLQGEDKQTGRLAKWLLALGWLITTVALADPVWEKVPKPVFQTNTARVLVLDLSSSMMIDDLKPSRLARARFKIEDILSAQFLKKEEGQTGLVVFAGDAFTVSPLTRDVDTIRSMLKVLSPQLLPAQGSRIDLGIKKAHELLKQSGAHNGSVLLIADGIADESLALNEAKALKNASHHLSILGVGTEAGGILPSMQRQQRINITVKLEVDALKALAQAGGGSYHTISNNSADLHYLLKKLESTGKNSQTSSQSKTDLVDDILSSDLNNEEWKSLGPFLIILLLPLAALAFRKGWLFSLVLTLFIAGTLAQPQTAMAFSFDDQWNKLWQNKAQRAEKALQQKQYDKASKLAKSPLRRGSAEYKKGDYDKALKSFKTAQGADARFDEGNALAKLKKYEEAIKAYEQALKEQPNMQDAKDNKKTIENFLKKKKEQQKKSQSDKNDKQSKDKKSGDQKKEGKSKQDSKQKKGDKDQKQEAKKKGEKSDKNQFSDANKNLDQKEKNKESQKEKKEEAQKKQQQQAKGDAEKEKKEKKKQEKAKTARTKSQANELNKEEKMAAEQWLRRIPDDPSGLLRRKFQRQYQRRRSTPKREAQPW